MGDTGRLFEIVRTLRGPGGCEWDRKQTALSMFRCLEEEVYELEEALVKNDLDNICEEMGDVLFQLVFIAQVFQETGTIQFKDVVDRVAEKMIRRHPHVYGDSVVESHAELVRQWDAIKQQEKGRAAEEKKSALDSVPSGMPSLVRALKVSKCAVKEGFEWDSLAQVLETARGELDELEAALKTGDIDESMMEFGDVLFSLVNVARFAGFHPEVALGRATAKFEGRFRILEELLKQQKTPLKALSREQKEQAWARAKKDYDA